MQENKKYALKTVFLVILALALGTYIGFKNSYVKESLAALSGFSVPNDIVNAPSEKDLAEFWEVWRLIEERHPDSDESDAKEKMWGAIQGLVDSLEDPYTVFLPPEENEDLTIDLKGEFSGVGMEVGMRDEGLVVIAPLKDSPAEKAGVLPGDVVLKIDDTLTAELDVDQAVDLIRGERGTSVRITIFRKGETETKEISIVRDTIKIPVLESEYREQDGIFIIRLFSFGEDSNAKFEEALSEFAGSGSKKLILDVRSNPGGFLSSAIDISSWFLEAGKTIVIEKGKIPEYNKTYKSRGHFLEGDYDMIVLVNGGSASASEIVAGALQEHKKARLVGKQTFGKGSVQELVPMNGGTALKITVAEWLTPNGVSISEEGLKPDVTVEFDPELYAKDKIDNQLEEAIKLLNKKK